MKKVLVITYHFPPRPSAGSVRLEGLANYLPQFGWQPFFLTPQLPSPPDPKFHVIQTPYPGDVIGKIGGVVGQHNSEAFTNRLKDTLADVELKGGILRELIATARGVVEFPDNHKLWRPIAVSAAEKFLQEHQVDALLSSCLPRTCHLIASDIKKKFSLPWIADFRDPWTNHHWNEYGMLRNQMDKFIEKKALRSCAAITTVSGPFADILKSLHPGKPITVITNGFDPKALEKKNIDTKKRFNIIYSGNIRGMQMQNLVFFFQAMSELLAEKHLDQNDIHIEFYGQPKRWIENQIRKYHLEKIAQQKGMVPRNRIMDIQQNAQILLLLDWNDPTAKGVYPAKVFEYLAAQRPILTIGKTDQNVIGDLLRQTHAGIHASTIEEIKKAIMNIYNDYRSSGNVPYQGIGEEINKYSHIEMARKFVALFNKIREGNK